MKVGVVRRIEASCADSFVSFCQRRSDKIAGLIPLSPPVITHFKIREKELMGRYEECAYFWRMMKLVGHQDVTLHELDGFNHGKMPEPAFPPLLKFMEIPVK